MKSFKSFQELTETCWPGYKQVGTKKKNGKEVPNCVPEENDIEEAPLVMNDMDIVRSILKKIEDDFSKLYTKKQFEKGWPKLQMIAKAAGYGISKSKQPQGKTYRYDLKK
jgi:hypothetical protein